MKAQILSRPFLDSVITWAHFSNDSSIQAHWTTWDCKIHCAHLRLQSLRRATVEVEAGDTWNCNRVCDRFTKKRASSHVPSWRRHRRQQRAHNDGVVVRDGRRGWSVAALGPVRKVGVATSWRRVGVVIKPIDSLCPGYVVDAGLGASPGSSVQQRSLGVWKVWEACTCAAWVNCRGYIGPCEFNKGVLQLILS